MPTTPTLGLPYPPETNPADVPVDMQALATAVETAILARQASSEKGVANGYAALDATGMIPSAQLPSGVFVPVSALGAANGVATLDSTGKVPAAQLPPGIVNVPLASFPPASPTADQIICLVLPASYDPIGGKPVRWLLSYDATNLCWDFVGGPDLYAEALPSVGTNSTSYVDLGGPSLTVPRAGSYLIDWGAYMGAGSQGSNGKISLTAGPGPADAISLVGTGFGGSSNATAREVALSALQAVAFRYAGTNATYTQGFSQRWLHVQPIRIT
jgi:hypothetical protein